MNSSVHGTLQCSILMNLFIAERELSFNECLSLLQRLLCGICCKLSVRIVFNVPRRQLREDVVANLSHTDVESDLIDQDLSSHMTESTCKVTLNRS